MVFYSIFRKLTVNIYCHDLFIPVLYVSRGRYAGPIQESLVLVCGWVDSRFFYATEDKDFNFIFDIKVS